MGSGEYLLEMIGISKKFPGVKALDNAQLKVRPGTVHALMGENGAGKSTLMKCLFGIYKEDEGEIIIDGEKIRFRNPRQALDHGVSMVHQELNQVLQRNVLDNIWLGRYPSKYGIIDQKQMLDFTRKILKNLEIDIDLKVNVGKLSVSQRQMVEIAKAVSFNCKILVLDEPTSSLTKQETEHLFKIIKMLKEKGCAIIYISHKIEEILYISDEVTIMRDGKWIATNYAKDLNNNDIIRMMVGRSLSNLFPEKNNKFGDVVLEVKNLTAKTQPSVKKVNFELRKGEILGIAGLVGSKRTELLEIIFGLAHYSEGEIVLRGKKITNNNPRKSIQNGFAIVTEERRKNGIFAMLSIQFNSIIANLNSYCKFGVVDDNKAKTDTNWIIEHVHVKTPNQKTLIRALSGGNQQKVIIGRWLLTEAEIYLLDEPTRGIDVGAKYEIYELIIKLAEQGKSVIVVSSEMIELLGITDNILVMSNGEVAGILSTKELDQEKIMTLATKCL